MRERLVELIQDSVGGCARHWAEIIADNLLANGAVIIDPQKYPPVNNQRIIKTILGVSLEEMAELIDAKQEGRIIALPCKVGETVYAISQTRDKRIMPFINSYEVTSIQVGKKKCLVYHEMDGYVKIFKQDDFGKTVFLTREEAEKALKGGETDAD